MIQKKEQKRILLDEVEVNWEFTVRETDVFQEMWNDGKSADSIAEQLRRPMLEIALLIIEQSALDGITPRRHGLYGS